LTERDFSFADALAAPFRLIRRHPLAVFVWGASMIVVTALIFWVLIANLKDLPVGQDMDAAASQAFALKMQSVSIMSNGLSIIQMLLTVVLYTAAMRATLYIGQKDRFLFLRVGMDEVRVAVVILALYIGCVALMVIAMLIGLVLGFAAWAVSPTAMVMVLLPYGLLICAGLLIAWSRVCLILPASVALKTFAFAEGWQLAKGRLWRLVGLNVATGLIYTVIYTIVFTLVIIALVAVFMASGAAWPQDPHTLGDFAGVVRTMTAPVLIALVPLSALYGVALCLVMSPLTRACQVLLREREPDPEIGFGSNSRDGVTDNALVSPQINSFGPTDTTGDPK